MPDELDTLMSEMMSMMVTMGRMWTLLGHVDPLHMTGAWREEYEEVADRMGRYLSPTFPPPIFPPRP